jgi:hypothetical protein
MPEYRVHMSGVVSFSVLVVADDPDEAIDKAYQERSPGICAQCSGWRQNWSLEIPDDWEPDAVDNCADGSEAWSAKQRWTRESEH